MEIHWSAATRFHNWMEKGMPIPTDMIRQFTEAGLLGGLDWIKMGLKGEKEKPDPVNASLLNYLSFKPKKNDLYTISGGGTLPFNWKFTMGLFPFNNKTGKVEGYNIFNLWLEKPNLYTQDGAEILFRTFKKMHNAENTEFAFIHPYKRWCELNDPFTGAYKIPITFNPMFTGVYWNTFLGYGQLELFDSNKINLINSNKIYRENANALYIRMTTTIEEVLDVTNENEMTDLAQQFKTALV